MNHFKHIIFFLFFSGLFFSCKNDLKLNAPYKELPSIYAVLNPNETTQMIRINKVFLGEGDANKMAQVSDSINYQPGELIVTLERYLSGVKSLATPTGNKDIITFTETVIQAAPGAFNSSQRVYVTSDKLFSWGEYVLTVTNTKTKNVFTARASSLDSVKASNVPPLIAPYFPVPLMAGNQHDPSVYINYSNPALNFSIRFYPNEAVLYQLTMRLHYYDYLITGDSAATFVDYPFANQTKKDATLIGGQGPFITNTFKGSDVYAGVGNSLSRNSRPISAILGRKVYKVQYIVYSSTQDYSDFLQYAAPSLSIAQEKPLYSNFDGKKALGIFAFRARFSVEKELDTDFISEFSQNSSTCAFKFYTSYKSFLVCNP